MNIKKNSIVLCIAASGLCLLPATVAWGGQLQVCRTITDFAADEDLEFSLTHNQMPGQLAVSTHKLRLNNLDYTLEAVSEAKGLLALLHSGQLKQLSEGKMDAQTGFLPTHYWEQRGKKAAQESVVDTETQEVLFTKDNSHAPYLRGLQDRLSMIYQMAAILSCQTKINTGDVVKMPVMSTGRVQVEEFTSKEKIQLAVMLKTGTQRLQTWLFESKADAPGDDIVRVWYAPQMDWRPVQIQIEDKEGKKLTQNLISRSKPY